MVDDSEADLGQSPEWWPFRNQLVITLVAMNVVQRRAKQLLIGVVADDHDHADGRQKFIEMMDSLLTFQEGNIGIEAPAVDRTTEEFIREEQPPESVLGWTHSCTDSNAACGECSSCMKRQRVLSKVY